MAIIFPFVADPSSCSVAGSASCRDGRSVCRRSRPAGTHGPDCFGPELAVALDRRVLMGILALSPGECKQPADDEAPRPDETGRASGRGDRWPDTPHGAVEGRPPP